MTQPPEQATIEVPLDGLNNIEAASRIVEEIKRAPSVQGTARVRTDRDTADRVSAINRTIKAGGEDAVALEVDIRVVDENDETVGGPAEGADG